MCICVCDNKYIDWAQNGTAWEVNGTAWAQNGTACEMNWTACEMNGTACVMNGTACMWGEWDGMSAEWDGMWGEWDGMSAEWDGMSAEWDGMWVVYARARACVWPWIVDAQHMTVGTQRTNLRSDISNSVRAHSLYMLVTCALLPRQSIVMFEFGHIKGGE